MYMGGDVGYTTRRGKKKQFIKQQVNVGLNEATSRPWIIMTLNVRKKEKKQEMTKYFLLQEWDRMIEKT